MAQKFENFVKKRDFKIHVNDQNSGFGKKIHVKQFQLPNGSMENFWTDMDSDSVQILPITRDETVYTVLQFRPGSEMYEEELPGGGLEKGEDPLVAATRELREETGLVSRNIIYLGSKHYSPYSSGIRHMFLALDCEDTHKQNLDPNEFLELKKWTLEEFRKELPKGRIRGLDTAYIALDKMELL